MGRIDRPIRANHICERMHCKMTPRACRLRQRLALKKTITTYPGPDSVVIGYECYDCPTKGGKEFEVNPKGTQRLFVSRAREWLEGKNE